MDTYSPKLLREELQTNGALHLDGPDGKRLFLVLNRNLGMDEAGVLIAYEGGGTLFYTPDRPLTQWQLAKFGFSLRVAPALTKMITDILLPDEASVEATLPLISSPVKET